MVSEHGFHGLNFNEKCDFSSYSVFSEFSWVCCDFEFFYSGLLLMFMLNNLKGQGGPKQVWVAKFNI